MIDILGSDPKICNQRKVSITSEPKWDGQSFANTIIEGMGSGHKYLVLSQCAHVCQRSVRFENWLYIRTYHDGYHLFSDEMLFDIDTDSHEQFNLAGKYPHVCQQAVYYFNEWHDLMMKTMDSPIDPLWVVMQEGGPFHAKGRLKEYCDFLDGTKRQWAIDELKKRHPGEFSI